MGQPLQIGDFKHPFERARVAAQPVRTTGEARMKALLSKEVGGPDSLVLDDMPAPQAKPGFAVLQVKAGGVNFPDTGTAESTLV